MRRKFAGNSNDDDGQKEVMKIHLGPWKTFQKKYSSNNQGNSNENTQTVIYCCIIIYLGMKFCSPTEFSKKASAEYSNLSQNEKKDLDHNSDYDMTLTDKNIKNRVRKCMKKMKNLVSQYKIEEWMLNIRFIHSLKS